MNSEISGEYKQIDLSRPIRRKDGGTIRNAAEYWSPALQGWILSTWLPDGRWIDSSSGMDLVNTDEWEVT